VGDRTINQFGADFRYAVEFSKYGRTPASVSRPAWGQPDLHYRLTATSPNRRCPPSRLPRWGWKPHHSGRPELFVRGCPRAVQSTRISTLIRPLCGSPWGMDEVTGLLQLRQTRRSAVCSLIMNRHRRRSASHSRRRLADSLDSQPGDHLHSGVGQPVAAAVLRPAHGPSTS